MKYMAATMKWNPNRGHDRLLYVNFYTTISLLHESIDDQKEQLFSRDVNNIMYVWGMGGGEWVMV